ncbi:hypothetical protein BGZ60DRAFT_532458 [Tricladium varicosporioides]|nr:hypothetical protein BGZ60DRAFT_532458 [Hymenoscyphus varicosporioides]
MKITFLVVATFAATGSLAKPFHLGLDNITPATSNAVPMAPEVIITSENTNTLAANAQGAVADDVEARAADKQWGGCNACLGFISVLAGYQVGDYKYTVAHLLVDLR